MSKTTNKFAPEVRERAVRMVLDHEGDHPSRWAAITSIAEKFGCSGHTLLEWVKKGAVEEVIWTMDALPGPREFLVGGHGDRGVPVTFCRRVELRCQALS